MRTKTDHDYVYSCHHRHSDGSLYIPGVSPEPHHHIPRRSYSVYRTVETKILCLPCYHCFCGLAQPYIEPDDYESDILFSTYIRYRAMEERRHVARIASLVMREGILLQRVEEQFIRNLQDGGYGGGGGDAEDGGQYEPLHFEVNRSRVRLI